MPALDRVPDVRTERRLLQGAVLVAGLVPVSGGLAGIILGPTLLDSAAMPGGGWDSHARYLSALLMGIGLSFWRLVPRIERAGSDFRLLTGLVVLGGLARLGTAVAIGAPPRPMLGGLAMELGVTPLLCLWQARVARRSGNLTGGPVRGLLAPADATSPNYSPSGSYGNPTLASTKKGRKLVGAILEDLREGAGHW
jgi:hypothetical protein